MQDIYQIRTVISLEEVIAFLVKGLNRGDDFGESIFNYMLRANESHGYYGFAVKDNNGELAGGILTPLQYQKNNVYSEKAIIGTSSWYMRNDCRGTMAIKFAEKVIECLDGMLIANYTPNKTATVIFKHLGFKQMKTIHLTSVKLVYLNLQRLIRCNVENENHSKYATKIDLRCRKCVTTQDTIFVEIKIGTDVVVIGGNKRRRGHRRLIFIEVSIPVFSITYTSDEDLLAYNWELVVYLLSWYFKVIAVQSDFPLGLDFNIYTFLGYNLIKPSCYITKGNLNDKFIRPLGSELSMNEI